MTDSMRMVVDGRDYPFPDLESLSFREAGVIKRATGLKMGDFVTAFEGGDVAVIAALALVAIRRQDGVVDEDALLDLPIAKIELVVPEGDGEDEGEDPDSPKAEPADGSGKPGPGGGKKTSRGGSGSTRGTKT